MKKRLESNAVEAAIKKMNRLVDKCDKADVNQRSTVKKVIKKRWVGGYPNL